MQILFWRLDKETSGLLVVAKTEAIYQSLASQFKAHNTERRYLALVCGIPKQPEGIVDLAIGRDRRERKKISAHTSKPREAQTHYQVLARYESGQSLAGGPFSLVAARPQTGRTHQIRVHLNHLGHPIVGDKVYGQKASRGLEKELHISRQMLHAEQLGFFHVALGKTLHFTAPPPDDMAEVLEWLATFQS